MARRHRIAFLALGTRGDVQTLALLAAETLRLNRSAEAHLITHAAHEVHLPDRCVYATRDVCDANSASEKRDLSHEGNHKHGATRLACTQPPAHQQDSGAVSQVCSMPLCRHAYLRCNTSNIMICLLHPGLAGGLRRCWPAASRPCERPGPAVARQ